MMTPARAGLLLSLGLGLSLGLSPWARPCGAQEPAPALADAYRDDRARDLVRLARARRATVDTRITSYGVTARERLSARMGAAGLDRLLFRRELVSRVDWTPDTVRIELLGAREAQPLVSGGTRLASPTVAAAMPSLAFNPSDSEMLLRVDSTTIRHPLAPGAEAYYRYAAGDSASVRLADGRTVRLVELRIAARRADARLINGSFWLDADSHAVVRATLRPSGGPGMRRRGISLLLPEAGAQLDWVGIDYALLDLRWWLPQLVVAHGSAHVGSLRFAMEYERRYEGYRVAGDTLAPPPALAAAGAATPGDTRRCRPRMYVSIGIGGQPTPARWDTAFSRAAAAVARPDSAQAGSLACERAFVVTHAPEANLVADAAFPAGIYDEAERVSDAEELRALSGLLRGIPGSPWTLSPPRLQLLAADLVRFNRVEGLSLGARGIQSLGPAELRGELRAGTTGEVGASLSGASAGTSLRLELTAYRELQAVDVASQPFSVGSSASALLLGRDENDYFRATGAELRLGPAPSRAQRWDLRLFAERQGPASARSGASLRGVFDDGFEVRPNLVAERLDQAGAVLGLRGSLGDDPGRLRARGDLRLQAETGDRSYGRSLLRLSVDAPLAGGFGLALSATRGGALGDVPAQGLWQIGGAATVRGHDPAELRGRQLWLGRGELTLGSPALRLAAFGDAGWAGEGWGSSARPLRGAGVGVSLLDNLLRVDLARGIGGGGLRAYLRMGGAL